MSTEFKSDVCYSSVSPLSGVDANTGLIKGVIIAREGIAKGHGVYLDAEFISEVARLGNEKEKGLKARFGHPSAIEDAIGSYIGRYKNFRVEKDKVYADLYLDDCAKDAPKYGNLYDWLLKMAAKNPDMFGNSIVFTSGMPKYSEYYNEITGEVEERTYATIISLNASDVVDTPAATESLFSAKKSFKSNLNIMEKSIKDKLLDVAESIKNAFSAEEVAEEVTEETVAENATTEEVAEESLEELKEEFKADAEEVELSEEPKEEEKKEEPKAEEPKEEEKEEELSTDESKDALAHAVESYEAKIEEQEKSFAAKEADHLHAFAELTEKYNAMKAELEAAKVELSAKNVAPTSVEGNVDAQIVPVKKEVSEGAAAILKHKFGK